MAESPPPNFPPGSLEDEPDPGLVKAFHDIYRRILANAGKIEKLEQGSVEILNARWDEYGTRLQTADADFRARAAELRDDVAQRADNLLGAVERERSHVTTVVQITGVMIAVVALIFGGFGVFAGLYLNQTVEIAREARAAIEEVSTISEISERVETMEQRILTLSDRLEEVPRQEPPTVP